MITEKKKGLSLNIVLLALIGFFATWGEGMQHVFSRASLIYPALVAVYVVFNYNNVLRIKKKEHIVPKEFKYLFIFVFIHTLIYVLLNINTIGFGSEAGAANDEGYSFGADNSGNIIVRYFLFLIFSLYLTVAIRDKKKLKIFALFYTIGFCFTIFGGAFHAYDNSMVRISGGLRDPNAMAFDALVSFIFSLYLFNEYKSDKKLKLLLIGTFVIEIAAILLSFSRGAFLAFGLWGILFYIRKGLFRSLGKIVLIGFVVFAIGNVLIRTMGIDTELIEARFSIEEMKESKGANRGYIWKAYLSKWDTYFITGMGMSNSPTVMRGNKEGVAETYESHNLYIQYFAEYGIIGILLYLAYWIGFIKQYRRTSGSDYILISVGVLFMVVTFFLNIDKGRTFWIVLSVINMVWMNNLSLRNRNKNEEVLGIRAVK